MGIEIASEKLEKNKSKKVPQSLVIVILYALGLTIGFSAAAHAAGDATAAEAIKQAENHITEMQKLGFGTTLANDTLNEAKLMYLKGNYAGAESLANYVGVVKKAAINVYALIDSAEAKLYDASSNGLDVSQAKKIFDSGIKAAENEEYLTAEQLINNAIYKTEEIQAAASMKSALQNSGGENISALFKSKWQTIATSIIVFFAAMLVFRKNVNAIKRKKRMDDLSTEIKIANNMARIIQKKYFEGRAISKSEYESGIKKYRECILAAKKELCALKNMQERKKDHTSPV